jgi:hypothetical protein
MALLEKAPSNIRDHLNGRRIYEKFVRPAMVDLTTVGAHYAMRSLFEEYPPQAMVYCYRVEQAFFRMQQVGRTKLAVGRVRVASTITGESAGLCFGAIHWGDHNISCCISPCPDGAAPEEAFAEELFAIFQRAEFPTALLMLEKAVGASTYSLRNLFRDEQRRILQIVLEANLSGAEGVYRQVYETNAPLLLFLKDLSVPAPRALAAAAEYLLNADIRRAFERPQFDPALVRQLLEAAAMHGVTLDGAFLEIAIRRRMEALAETLQREPADSGVLQQLEAIAGLLPDFPFEVNLRTVQNIYFRLLQTEAPEMKRRGRRREKKTRRWVDLFLALGGRIGMRTDE